MGRTDIKLWNGNSREDMGIFNETEISKDERIPFWRSIDSSTPEKR